MKRLSREAQCRKCPWKKSTNPYDIPNGYSVDKHCNLKETIAQDPLASLRQDTLRIMACHESTADNEQHCVGWLINQLGQGNNLGLRLSMIGYDLSRVRTIGEQHETFEDTLPQ